MGTQLQRDLKSPGSPFQMFLKYSPDALNHLFDRWNTWRPKVFRTFFHVRCMMNIFRCMMKPVDLQLQGRLFFDLFLFAPCHQTGCELGKWFGFLASEYDEYFLPLWGWFRSTHLPSGIIAAILDAKKERFLLHPTFDLFLQVGV